MKINYLIVTKTNLITKYYKTLENFRSLSLDNFLADYSQQLLAERLLHLQYCSQKKRMKREG
jgi:hypothetical protein